MFPYVNYMEPDVDMKNTVRAVLCAPLVPGLLVNLLSWNPVGLLFAVPIGYLAMAFLGLPLYLLVRRHGRVSLAACLLGGAVAGAIVCLLGGWWTHAVEATVAYVASMAVFVMFGIISGASFWWIGGGRRLPDAVMPE